MPGIRTDLPGVDWYIVRGDKWDLDGYARAGGNPERCIAHFQQESADLEPFWTDKGFKLRIDRLRSHGITRVVGMDFSTFLEWPLPMCIYNVYRSSVVNQSIGECGFEIITQPKYHCMPQHLGMYVGSWPTMPDGWRGPVFIDTHTLRGVEINDRIFRTGAPRLRERWPSAVIWIWSKSPRYPNWWAKNIGPCVWVKTRSYFQARVITHRHSLRAGETSDASELSEQP